MRDPFSANFHTKQALAAEQEKVKELLVQKDLFLMTKRELSTAQARIEELENERQQRESTTAVSKQDSQQVKKRGCM